MSHQFILETSRLQLRTFALQDAQDLFHLNADPLVLKYTGDLAFKDENEASDFILHYDHYREYGYGRWAVIDRESEVFLGWCGLKYSSEKKETDIGFRLQRRYWGKGFATEAAKACMNYGFTELGLTRIVGRAQTKNIPSLKVLEKIGMTLIANFEEDSEQWLIFEKSQQHK